MQPGHVFTAARFRVKSSVFRWMHPSKPQYQIYRHIWLSLFLPPYSASCTAWHGWGTHIIFLLPACGRPPQPGGACRSVPLRREARAQTPRSRRREGKVAGKGFREQLGDLYCNYLRRRGTERGSIGSCRCALLDFLVGSCCLVVCGLRGFLLWRTVTLPKSTVWSSYGPCHVGTLYLASRWVCADRRAVVVLVVLMVALRGEGGDDVLSWSPRGVFSWGSHAWRLVSIKNNLKIIYTLLHL